MIYHYLEPFQYQNIEKITRINKTDTSISDWNLLFMQDFHEINIDVDKLRQANTHLFCSNICDTPHTNVFV